MVQWIGGEIIIPRGGGMGDGRSEGKMSLCPAAGKWSFAAPLLDS